MQRQFAEAAAPEVMALLEQAGETLSLDSSQAEEVSYYLSKAWMAGAIFGQERIVVQAEQQEAAVDLTVFRPRSPGEKDAG